MSALDNIKAKLPGFIARNQTLNDLLGPIGYIIDSYNSDADTFRSELGIEDGNSSMLDALAADYGLRRQYNDTDKIMAIRIMNAIKTHQNRGTVVGLENEGREIALVTPYDQSMRFVLGQSPIGTGWALGGVEATWIHYWRDTPETEAEAETQLRRDVIPLHVKDGLNSINAYEATEGYQSIRGADLLDGDTYTITNTGFINNKNTLIPENENPVYTFGNIDLLGTYATYQWLVDWVDYTAWDLDFDVLMEVRFSSDEAAWNAWTPYQRDQ